ncbi:DUF4381 domain-containing protein [Photobacterium japonica]|uniref:DUF4381 domain-containing protein n=1 Tax=Photobacterium japonica TaxID=2910235 RepID=UPI003D0CF7A9
MKLFTLIMAFSVSKAIAQLSEHTPPSSYMLREMHEVPVPDSVSLWPQTVGWQVLGVIVVLWLAYMIYRRVWVWWQNRYRTEALAALDTLGNTQNMTPSERSQALFRVLKTVLVYLDSRHASLFGVPFLQQLERYMPHSQGGFNTALGQRWMQSLVNPTITLDASECKALFACSRVWIKAHEPRLGRVDTASDEHASETQTDPTKEAR